MPFPPDVAARLSSIYEDLLWLANRQHVTPRQARAWYSQVLAIPMAPKVRRFTGMVSRKAIAVVEGNIEGSLVLEHPNRISHSLSRLIETHLEQQINDSTQFLALIEHCEQVNITTDEENHRLRTTAGNYDAANIELVEWNTLSDRQRAILWETKLRRNVSNAAEYSPHAET
jgi:hypothetical protein